MPTIAALLAPLAEADPAAVEALLDQAFGRDRHARTAYRLRDGVTAIPALSFAAFEGDRLVASLQSWPVELAAADGALFLLVLVGPVAVAPDRQNDGLGRRLMAALLERADARGDALTLIGDAPYYGRFGFAAAPTQDWRLPGPVDRDRLLARLPAGVAVPDAGVLRARSGTIGLPAGRLVA